jgi:O-antigen/teichoic acid export membrane protein
MAVTQSFGRSALMRAALLTTGSTYIAFVLGLLVSVLIARVLGPEDYGRYAYVVWLSGILIMLTNNGLNMTGTKFVSEALGREEPETAARIHGWLLRKQWW